MDNRSVISQVKAGFRRASVWLLAFGWGALVIAGIGIALTPSPYPSVAGWILLAIAAVVLIATMNRWVEVFSALLAYGIIGGVVTIVSGHVVNRPDVPVPRLYAVIMTLLIAGSAVVSFTFAKRKLRLPDRIALFGFVVCFFWKIWEPVDHERTVWTLAVGFSLLLAASAYDRICRPRDKKRRGSPRRTISSSAGRES